MQIQLTIAFVTALIAAPALADETCQSPYMPKLAG